MECSSKLDSPIGFSMDLPGNYSAGGTCLFELIKFSPAWVMAGVWTVFWACMAKWYRDPISTESIELGPQRRGLQAVTITIGTQNAPPPAEEPRMSKPQWGVCFTMCWFAMTCFFILGAWEGTN